MKGNFRAAVEEKEFITEVMQTNLETQIHRELIWRLGYIEKYTMYYKHFKGGNNRDFFKYSGMWKNKVQFCSVRKSFKRLKHIKTSTLKRQQLCTCAALNLNSRY